MKVLKITFDTEKYSTINFDSIRDWTVQELEFDSLSKSSFWAERCDGYFVDPRKPQADFMQFSGGAMVVAPRVYDDNDMVMIFEFCGELLPIRIEGVRYYIWNVTNCINALSQETTVFEGGLVTPKRVVTPAFRTTRFDQTTVFKVPETRWYDIYCVTEDRENDFYALYHERGYSGLCFTEMKLDVSDASSTVK